MHYKGKQAFQLPSVQNWLHNSSGVFFPLDCSILAQQKKWVRSQQQDTEVSSQQQRIKRS